MIKKVVLMASTAALVACLGLAGCSSDDLADSTDDTSSQSESTTEKSTAEESEATEETEESTSDYEVTIDSAVLSEDYEGNPAAIVTFSWTNNSDETTSAAVALYMQCFQNGVACDTAILDDYSDYTDGYMADVKPGYSTTFSMAYTLEDESDITVEVTEWLSWDDTILAEETFSLE